MYVARALSWRISMVGRNTLLAIFLLCVPFLSGQSTGYWHTSGNRILDSSNKPVRISGINWYGFETASQTVNGLYAQDYKFILQKVKADGFNAVRIPLSSQMIEKPATELNIAYTNHSGPINGELRGLNSMQVLDSIVAYAGEIGLKVILDHHRSEAGSSAESTGLWYTTEYPESAWSADWAALADRYLSNPTVVGFDLHNEPHSQGGGGACWDCGGPNDWHLAAARAGNAVLAVNPKLLIFVEGTDVYNGDSYWWGGNLEGVARSPVVLNLPGHVVYSAHDYGPEESKQTWFNENTTLESLSAVWNKHWGFISRENIAPVWLGEFGTTNDEKDLQSETAGSEGQWFQGLVEYLAANPNLSWSYWALNGEDRYGYLDFSYAGVASSAKASMLTSIDRPRKTAVASLPTPSNSTATPEPSSGGTKLGWTVVAGSGLTFAIFFGTHSGHTDAPVANNATSANVQAAERSPGTKYIEKPVSRAKAPAPLQEVQSATDPAKVPVAPKSLVAAASATQAFVAWSGIEAEGATYTISKGTAPESIVDIVAKGVSGTSYLVPDLNPGTAYYFQVRSEVDGVSSASSPTASAITKVLAGLTPPTGLTATATAGGIQLSWTASRTKVARYNVYGGGAPGDSGKLLAADLLGTTYKAGKLPGGGTYTFTVKAVVGKLVSAESNEVSITLPETSPDSVAHAGYGYLKQLGSRLSGKEES